MRQVVRALPSKEKDSASPDVRTPEKGLKKTSSISSFVRQSVGADAVLTRRHIGLSGVAGESAPVVAV